MPFLEIISLALVFVWTLRLARSKSRNPWVWCGAAMAPVFLSIVTGNVSWQFLGMVPMAILLFMKAPRTQTGPGPAGASCPRCQATQPHGRYYCTNCGWELANSYPADGVLAEEKPRIATLTESLETASAVGAAAPAETLGTDAVVSTQAEDPPSGGSAVEETTPPPEVPPEVASEEPLPAPSSPPLAMPTAASLTQRGIARLNEGRVQESIDQFTKALAMDPNYAQAWEQRAGAYDQLGREREAAEDRLRMAAIYPS